MKIAFVEIENFRKLKSCRIDLSDKTTLLVGANNSGKTSAMEAMVRFLKERQKFSYTDFTISNWGKIESIGNGWIQGAEVPRDLAAWSDYLPSLDLWIEARFEELQYVYRILPSLGWQEGLIGIRLRFQPKNIEELFKAYRNEMDDLAALRQSAKVGIPKSLSSNLREYLEKNKNLTKHFHIVAYLLDPASIKEPIDSVAQPQPLPPTSLEITEDVLQGLIKIDVVNAQRGFSDDNSSDFPGETNTSRNLSTQLRRYYENHINPMVRPDPSDLEAIQSIEEAQGVFDQKLNSGFESAFTELQSLGYPGFSDPKITLSSKLQPIESLNHATAVQYDVVQGGASHLRLPERYAGLGYQNLVSMVFKLILFRDEWMRVGKLRKTESDSSPGYFEPIHLVLVEEPEAHLHAQVQQVFINKAYSVLRNHKALGNKNDFVTQLIVSTHSSHIAHECYFSDLRYFRRSPARGTGEVPEVHVVNLGQVFGPNDETNKFASRYLKATHCDLFFADAVILVEGPAERILLPGLIRKHIPYLSTRFLTLLEIGGSHAHRLRPLVELLRIPTLVITDLDALNSEGTATLPAPKQSQKTGNATLKSWLPQKDLIDDLFAAKEIDKISKTGLTRIAFQTPFEITFNKQVEKVFPYTFEDALILENLNAFKSMDSTSGLLKKVVGFANSQFTIGKIAGDLFITLQKGSRLKAEFAMEVLYSDQIDTLAIPSYIKEGLGWLRDQLSTSELSIIMIPDSGKQQ